MGVLIDKNIDSKEKVKSTVLEFLEKNEIPYNLTENDNVESICIDLNFDDTFKSDFYYAPLMIETSDKDICKVPPYEIMHIAIEDRESVLYLIDKRVVRTPYHISHWEDILSSRCFKRPHHSYIVNLNYVIKVTKYFVHLKYRNNQYSYLTMSAYGLKIESKSINNQSKVLVICTSPAKWFNKWNKYNKYIINLYNIVAVFKCILSTRDSEMITECYELIIKNDNIDPYLYFLVSYFLYEYDKQQFEKYKKDFGCYLHKNCSSNWKQEEPFIKNLLSVLCDITRDEKIYIKVNEFLKFYQS